MMQKSISSPIGNKPTNDISIPDAPNNNLQIGCLVKWNKKTLSEKHWWATSDKPVKVKNIVRHDAGMFKGDITVYFETPIEVNWSGETNAAFFYWLELC